MSSIESSTKLPTSSSTVRDRVLKYWQKMGNLNLLAGLRSQEQMEEELQESLLNQRAENQKVRETAWGFKTPDEVTDEGDDMRETVLGDKTTHTHYHNEATAPKKSGSGLGKLALAAGLGIPLTALAIMAPSIIDAVNDDPAPVVIEQEPSVDTDTDTQYELQFFED